MKRKILFLIFIISVVAQAKKQEVVYGEDDRVEISETRPSIQKLGTSVAAMFYDDQYEDGKIQLSTLSESEGVCEDEKFASMPTGSFCTGFLVGENKVLTANHCVDEFLCPIALLVFDFNLKSVNEDLSISPKRKNLYRCKKVIQEGFEGETGLDFSLIEIEPFEKTKGKAQSKTPLKLSTSGKVKDETKLFVLGHPSGMPLIKSGNGKIWDNKEKNFFKANLDTFRLNSGSPVFNEASREVEGFIVRGAQDYEFDEVNQCYRVRVCDEEKASENCEGEDVHRILTQVTELFPNKTVQ